MTAWTDDELGRIEQTDELSLASQLADGSLGRTVTIWVVRDGDDLYVRSIHGRNGGWFQAAESHNRGHIRAGGVDKDVAFVAEADPGLNERIDQAYRTKYRGYGTNIVGSVVNPDSRESTLRLVPR
jgi:hypothetical protein